MKSIVIKLETLATIMALVQQCFRLNFLPVEMSNWLQGTTKNKSIELLGFVINLVP